MPDHLADILAEGFIARLRRRVWEQLNDVIGSGDDVESLCSWKGPTRSLSAAMSKAEYIREIQGVYVCCDAVTEAPEYIKQRWRRSNLAGYNAARSRAEGPALFNEPKPSAKQHEGDVTTEAGGSANAGDGESHAAEEPKNPGFVRVKEFWHKLYLARTGNKYPWRGHDFKCLAKLIELAKDIHALEPVMRAYIKCNEPFYAGWELRWLFRDYARFSAGRKHGRPAASKSEIATDAGAL